MVTPRGYTNKYEWDGTVREGQRPGFSLVLPRDGAEPDPALNPSSLGLAAELHVVPTAAPDLLEEEE
jgi:hypothetical protein